MTPSQRGYGNVVGRLLNNIFKLRAEKAAFVKGDDAVVFADVVGPLT